MTGLTACRTALTLVLISATTVLVAPAGAFAASTVVVPLGSAARFAVLGATTVTNTGLTTVTGDLGVSPGTAVTGFGPGQINDGALRSNDAIAQQAHADLVIAYNNAAARPATSIPGVLGGTTVTSGVYTTPPGTLDITGTVTLDAQNNPDAIFIFRAASTLITAADSAVELVNGAQSCNVFWLVGSSATLGASTDLRGDILAHTSITVGAQVAIDGRALAINGAVTLDTDTITRSSCDRVLSISVPAAADLGGGKVGKTVAGALGPVTVTDSRGLAGATWTASVTASRFETAGPVHSIARSNVTYWSGPATWSRGSGDFTPGQLTSGDATAVSAPATAFSLANGAGTTAATWEPTLIVEVPADATVGEYSATVTTSVT